MKKKDITHKITRPTKMSHKDPIVPVNDTLMAQKYLEGLLMVEQDHYNFISTVIQIVFGLAGIFAMLGALRWIFCK